MEPNEATPWRNVPGKVVAGHGVASGQAEHSPYPSGSIEMQMPFFRRLGIDLSEYHPATINVDISPARFLMTGRATTLKGIEWTHLHPPEDFSFSRCRLLVGRRKVTGLIYFPHLETKERHFQSDTTMEVLAPFVEGLDPGAPVMLEVNPREVEIV